MLYAAIWAGELSDSSSVLTMDHRLFLLAEIFVIGTDRESTVLLCIDDVVTSGRARVAYAALDPADLCIYSKLNSIAFTEHHRPSLSSCIRSFSSRAAEPGHAQSPLPEISTYVSTPH